MGEARGDEVGDCLGLAGSRWAFEPERPAVERPLDSFGL